MSNSDKAFSVTQINKYLKAVMDEDYVLKSVRIEGEISNFKHNFSGHLYFTLKDEESAISCVMFAGDAENLDFVPSDGMKATVSGGVSVYVKNGQYQIYVRKIERQGKGGLLEKFEELKRKLLAEGIFDPSRKKPLPSNPRSIAVITSPTGSAIKDILSVAQRRNKSVKLLIFPVPVQGDGAAAEISQAIFDCNALNCADLIIVGRGGGSIEDLWAFNEECVARAIYASVTPVISAVGHETDFTIADFAADCRAATPSVSAEIAVPLLQNRKEIINSAIFLIDSGMMRIIKSKKRDLQAATDIIEAVSPLNVLKRGYSLTYDEHEENLIKSASQLVKGNKITTILNDVKILSEIVEIRFENEEKEF